MNQKQRISANAKANIIEVGSTVYKGANPVYQGAKHPLTQVMTYFKVAKGIPFVKVVGG